MLYAAYANDAVHLPFMVSVPTIPENGTTVAESGNCGPGSFGFHRFRVLPETSGADTG